MSRLLIPLLLAIVVCTSLSLLILRYWLLPDVERYREDIAFAITQASGQRVTIGQMSADWDELHPHFTMDTVQVYDKENVPVLLLNKVDSTLSWFSLLYGELYFNKIKINQPNAIVRRDSSGTIYLAGITLNKDKTEASNNFLDWLLRQREVAVDNANIYWQDEQLRAPLLEFKEVTLNLKNYGDQHEFSIDATPPSELSAPLSFRGNFSGISLDTFDQWHGRLSVQSNHTNVFLWQTWLPFPEAIRFNRGIGSLRIWIGMEDGHMENLTADLGLQDVGMHLAQDLPELNLIHLHGRVGWKKEDNNTNQGAKFFAKQLEIAMLGEHTWQSLDFLLQAPLSGNNTFNTWKLNADQLNLGMIEKLVQYLPVNKIFQKQLNGVILNGEIRDVLAEWNGDQSVSESLNIRGEFSNLGVQKLKGIPTFSGISGRLDFSDRAGVLNLDSKNFSVELPNFFHEVLLLDKLTGQINWNLLIDKDEIEFKFSDISFKSNYVTGNIHGTYLTEHNSPGVLDLVGDMTHIDAHYALHQIPLITRKSLYNWLDKSIVSGELGGVRLHIKGNLASFPFNKDTQGIFQIDTRVSGVVLDHIPGWPRIENISTNLLFYGNHLEMSNLQANTLGTKIENMELKIADVTARNVILETQGKITGPTKEFIELSRNTRMNEYTSKIIGNIGATGNGELLFKSTIPLQNSKNQKLTASYRFIDNEINFNQNLPNLKKVNGMLKFTESTIKTENISAQIMGGPATIDSTTSKLGDSYINVIGKIDFDALKKNKWDGLSETEKVWLDYLYGKTNWRAIIHINNGVKNIMIASSLDGIVSHLPAPFYKTIANIAPFRLNWNFLNSNHNELDLSYGKLVSLRIMHSRDTSSALSVSYNQISPNSILSSLPGNLSLTGSLPTLEVDQWLDLFNKNNKKIGSYPNLEAINLQVGTFDFLGRRFNKFILNANRIDSEWRSDVISEEMNGNVVWQSSGNGKIVMRLKKLSVPSFYPKNPNIVERVQKKDKDLPALDVIAEDFILKGEKLGEFELIADQREQDWYIKKLRITSPESLFMAHGTWQSNAAPPRVQLDVKLETSDIHALLARFNNSNRVKRGRGKIEGILSWSGVPQSIDYETLSGNIKLEAQGGQFPKFELGISKLFGIFDLRSLPRRMLLDFRDVFSAGFAFDEFSGDFNIAYGVASTNNVKIRGPAAEVVMNGQIDLLKETQKLHITVTPSLGLVAPVVGVATIIESIIKNTALENSILSNGYNITGSWADPIIIKLGSKEEKSNGPE